MHFYSGQPMHFYSGVDNWDRIYPVWEDEKMAGKREKPEDIVLKLRQVEVLQGQGKRGSL